MRRKECTFSLSSHQCRIKASIDQGTSRWGGVRGTAEGNSPWCLTDSSGFSLSPVSELLFELGTVALLSQCFLTCGRELMLLAIGLPGPQ